MLTLETTLERSPEPAALPSSDGWYDPDSIVFQSTDDDDAAVRLVASAAGEVEFDEPRPVPATPR